VEKPRSRGFTLVELLVVLGISALVFGLLLPAIQSVRKSQNRLVCINNLRQIGLGLHQFNDSYSCFPKGYVPPARKSTWNHSNWRVFILPFIDQENAFARVGQSYSSNLSPFFENHPLRYEVFRIFGCPEDPRVFSSWNVFPRTGEIRVALSSYLGVNGTDVRKRDGALYFNSGTRLSNFLDGTSHTVLVGERPPSPDLIYGWWYAGVGFDDLGTGDAHLGTRELNTWGKWFHRCGSGPFSFSSAKSSQDFCATFQFWSLHPGGANFSMADGSTRFLNYSAGEVLAQMGTIAGGEVTHLD
jgi:prepilin-type N-terminal cleavage/methylation domain-containing protein/prepilin-type processing-associated H-X9-DG protein